MDIEPSDKKSSFFSVIMSLWLVILTLLVVWYMFKPSKSGQETAISESKPITVSRKISSPDSRQGQEAIKQELPDDKLNTLNQLADKVSDLNRRLAKTEQARIELQKNQQGVIDSLLKKINELESAVASKSQITPVHHRKASDDTSLLALADTEPTDTQTIKTIRKQWNTYKPARFSATYLPDQDDYEQRILTESAAARSPQMGYAVSEIERSRSIEPAAHVQRSFASSSPFTTAPYTAKNGSAIKETYKSDFRPIYEERRRDGIDTGSVVIYSTSSPTLSSWNYR